MLERGLTMKYTNPLYNMENVETTDIMDVSIIKVGYIDKVIGTDENGDDITVGATQVTVDVSNLF